MVKETLRKEAWRKIFWLEFAAVWSPFTLYVNIDEVSISRNTKLNYFWSQKGISSKFQNIWFSGSTSLIWAITSTGDWFATILSENNNSENFKEFIVKLMNWLTTELEVAVKDVMLLLDNCAIHHAKKLVSEINSHEWKVMFLSPNSPEFAPIELLFNTLKRRLLVQTKCQMINLKSEEGARNIKECLATFTHKELISYWKKCFQQIGHKLN